MHVNLDNWYKPELDKKKLKALSKRRDLPGLVHFFFYFLFLFASGYLASTQLVGHAECPQGCHPSPRTPGSLDGR